MAFRETFYYNRYMNKVQGYEDFEEEKGDSIPTNIALVAMVCSICGDWRVPVAYLLSQHSCKAKLEIFVKNFMIKLRSIGLTAQLLTTDQRSNFVKLTKILVASKEKPFSQLIMVSTHASCLTPHTY